MSRLFNILLGIPVVILIVLLLPWVVLWIVTYLFYGIALQLIIWTFWCVRGTNVLLVSSNSPNWHDYLDREVVPRLPSSTIVLNWSERSTWRGFSLAVLALRYFSEEEEYPCPLVIVFHPFRWAKTFCFRQAFRDFKHGKTSMLEKAEADLMQHLKLFNR